jgi:hypothetical protein
MRKRRWRITVPYTAMAPIRTRLMTNMSREDWVLPVHLGRGEGCGAP